MNKTTQSKSAAVAEWTVVNGKPLQNEAANKVQSDYYALRKQFKAMQATYVGAFILGWLSDHPWLKSATISLEVSFDGNDEGGTYRSIHSKVSDVEAVQNIAVPEELTTDDGSFDDDSAEEFLNEDINGDLIADELYIAVREHYDADDCEIRIDRDKLAHLLGQEVASGKEAFLILLPNESTRFGEPNQVKQTAEAVEA